MASCGKIRVILSGDAPREILSEGDRWRFRESSGVGRGREAVEEAAGGDAGELEVS